MERNRGEAFLAVLFVAAVAGFVSGVMAERHADRQPPAAGAAAPAGVETPSQR